MPTTQLICAAYHYVERECTVTKRSQEFGEYEEKSTYMERIDDFEVNVPAPLVSLSPEGNVHVWTVPDGLETQRGHGKATIGAPFMSPKQRKRLKGTDAAGADSSTTAKSRGEPRWMAVDGDGPLLGSIPSL